MTKIVIVGSGGFAAEITSFFKNTSAPHYENLDIQGYIDYEENIDKYWKRYNLDKPVLNDIDNYKISEDEFFVVGIADNHFRNFVIKRIKEKGGRFINLIHPTALVDEKSLMGKGNIISPYSIIGPNVEIGDFNVLTEQSIISHDCRVGNNNVFSTSVLCGHVKIGDDNYFGVRSTVIPHVSFGNRNVVQAGMVVDKDVKDDSVVFHRFKEKVIAVPRETKGGC
jgi:sugar O-acyltransferase (sialic acid O-acetyltransferase NeuD family)